MMTASVLTNIPPHAERLPVPGTPKAPAMTYAQAMENPVLRSSPVAQPLLKEWGTARASVIEGSRSALRMLTPLVAPAATIFLVGFGLKTMLKGLFGGTPAAHH